MMRPARVAFTYDLCILKSAFLRSTRSWSDWLTLLVGVPVLLALSARALAQLDGDTQVLIGGTIGLFAAIGVSSLLRRRLRHLREDSVLAAVALEQSVARSYFVAGFITAIAACLTFIAITATDLLLPFTYGVAAGAVLSIATASLRGRLVWPNIGPLIDQISRQSFTSPVLGLAVGALILFASLLLERSDTLSIAAALTLARGADSGPVFHALDQIHGADGIFRMAYTRP